MQSREQLGGSGRTLESETPVWRWWQWTSPELKQRQKGMTRKRTYLESRMDMVLWWIRWKSGRREGWPRFLAWENRWLLVTLTEASNPRRRIKSILKGFQYGMIALTMMEIALGTTKLRWEWAIHLAMYSRNVFYTRHCAGQWPESPVYEIGFHSQVYSSPALRLSQAH